MSGNIEFSRQVWGGGVKKYRTAVLMTGGTIDKEFNIHHGSYICVHHHRMVGMTTTTAWVGMGVDFRNPSMEAILSCGAPRKFNNIWDSASKPKASGVESQSQ